MSVAGECRALSFGGLLRPVFRGCHVVVTLEIVDKGNGVGHAAQLGDGIDGEVRMEVHQLHGMVDAFLVQIDGAAGCSAVFPHDVAESVLVNTHHGGKVITR